ncbi:MAG: hypothetical protein LBV44_08725, partial [Methylobacillus sp.]|nr:hypothetical protein [Methylobacillus sp.]
ENGSKAESLPGGRQQEEMLVSGVEKGDKAAFETLLVGARGGDARAQYNLGDLYLSGTLYRVRLVANRDSGEGLQWMRKSAAQRYDRALAYMGMLYFQDNSRFVAHDKVAAYAFFTLLAEQDPEGELAVSLGRVRDFSEQEIQAGKALADQMREPDHLLKALDDYLAAPHNEQK